MIKKAVILAAGKGTRMLEITSGASKEMLMLKNKPIILYSIKEALDAGCTNICIVIDSTKKDLHDYLVQLRTEKFPITIIFREPRGIMDAITATKDFVEQDDFTLLLPDMLHFGNKNATKQVCETCEAFKKNVIAVINEPERFGKGNYAAGEEIAKDVISITSIHAGEKMGLGLFGRYAFLNSVFSYLGKLSPEESELLLLNKMIEEKKLYGTLLEGDFYDTGIPEGYFATKYALKRAKDI